MKRPLYTVEINCWGWSPILCASQCISRRYCEGFMDGMAQHYPCPELRVVTDEGEVVAVHRGHGAITTGDVTGNKMPKRMPDERWDEIAEMVKMRDRLYDPDAQDLFDEAKRLRAIEAAK